MKQNKLINYLQENKLINLGYCNKYNYKPSLLVGLSCLLFIPSTILLWNLNFKYLFFYSLFVGFFSVLNDYVSFYNFEIINKNKFMIYFLDMFFSSSFTLIMYLIFKKYITNYEALFFLFVYILAFVNQRLSKNYELWKLNHTIWHITVWGLTATLLIILFEDLNINNNYDKKK